MYAFFMIAEPYKHYTLKRNVILPVNMARAGGEEGTEGKLQMVRRTLKGSVK
jgi:hypothetical protein